MEVCIEQSSARHDPCRLARARISPVERTRCGPFDSRASMVWRELQLDAREKAVIGDADLNRYNGVLICFSTNEVTHVLHFVQIKVARERATHVPGVFQ